MEAFWAGILGAGIGAAAGAYQKRTDPSRTVPVAAGVAVAVFVVVFVVLALI